jgi:phage shock protein PspC (stress-responsive transcriptional regulator)|tara:strand:+ start:667 stop:897 length:231 start_codon:yes stop_codon:yes gene_type:complete
MWRSTVLDYNQTNYINMPAKLRKSRTDKMLAGVCGGFAEYLGWDATLVRIIFALILVSSFGTAVLAYFILAIVMPD